MNLLLTAALSLALPAQDGSAKETAAAPDRPNILWISAEDISPDLGAYGDAYADTPRIDALATEGALFTNCYANAGVCAVARSCIITGMYPPSMGTQHMRGDVPPPPFVKCFPEYLRAAGYFTTNKSKTDYNFDAPPSAWDRNGNKHGDWSDRPTPDTPFFSVVNFTISHESKVRSEAVPRTADPAKVKLPPFIPDTKESRRDRAHYYDNIAELDRQVGQVLDRLEADGLAESTVVMFWGDHGAGLPRQKRWIYDSGLQVPLIVRWPSQIRPGTRVEELVSFVDFAPSTLSLAGLTPPDYMQGHSLVGPDRDEPRRYIYAHRDRMDEAYDLIRAVRDKRYKYIRNFMPQRSRGQHLEYMDQMPTMRAMRRLNAAGELKGAEKQYFEPTKPVEELYDTTTDPWEVENVAADPDHAEILERLRGELEDWQDRIGDLGLVPEPVLMERLRPGDVKERTAPPTATLEPVVDADGDDTGRVRVTLACPTEGSSIVYGLGDEDPAARLYTAPFAVEPGTEVQALACRLGFRDSEWLKRTATAEGAE